MSWFVLVVVSLGSVYLLASVGVSIYRRRHAVPTGERVSAQLTSVDIQSCFDDLEDVSESLVKHLENFHHLLAHYESEEVQRWDEEGGVWRKQWKVLGERCQFETTRTTTFRKEFEEMAAAYSELEVTQRVYTDELKRFVQNRGPRLDQLRERLAKIGVRIARAASQNGERKP